LNSVKLKYESFQKGVKTKFLIALNLFKQLAVSSKEKGVKYNNDFIHPRAYRGAQVRCTQHRMSSIRHFSFEFVNWLKKVCEKPNQILIAFYHFQKPAHTQLYSQL